MHVEEWDQLFHCVLYLKKHILAVDNSNLGYLVSNLNKETCSYHKV